MLTSVSGATSRPKGEGHPPPQPGRLLDGSGKALHCDGISHISKGCSRTLSPSIVLWAPKYRVTVYKRSSAFQSPSRAARESREECLSWGLNSVTSFLGCRWRARRLRADASEEVVICFCSLSTVAMEVLARSSAPPVADGTAEVGSVWLSTRQPLRPLVLIQLRMPLYHPSIVRSADCRLASIPCARNHRRATHIRARLKRQRSAANTPTAEAWMFFL